MTPSLRRCFGPESKELTKTATRSWPRMEKLLNHRHEGTVFRFARSLSGAFETTPTGTGEPQPSGTASNPASTVSFQTPSTHYDFHPLESVRSSEKVPEAWSPRSERVDSQSRLPLQMCGRSPPARSDVQAAGRRSSFAPLGLSSCVLNAPTRRLSPGQHSGWRRLVATGVTLVARPGASSQEVIGVSCRLSEAEVHWRDVSAAASERGEGVS